MSLPNNKSTRAQSFRIHFFDVARGLCVISMVVFHFCYDLKYLSGFNLIWFQGIAQNVWRCSISWTFLFISGIMCALSKNNFRRAIQYGVVALLVWAVTTIAAVDKPISFGIIFCIFACTLVAALAEKAGIAAEGPVAAVVLFLAFLCLQGIQTGQLNILGAKVIVPKGLYSTECLAWLGFPGPKFASGDYYPLLPYLFDYLAGSAMGRWFRGNGWPNWMSGIRFTPLEWIGRHALLIYVLHQPILLAITALIG